MTKSHKTAAIHLELEVEPDIDVDDLAEKVAEFAEEQAGVLAAWVSHTADDNE